MEINRLAVGFAPRVRPASADPFALGAPPAVSDPAQAAKTSRASGLKGAPLPFDSMLDALMNLQSSTAPLVMGADGRPDLRASVLRGVTAAGGTGHPDGAGLQVLTRADDGASDAFSLNGLSSSDIAENLIDQVGGRGQLAFSDVLDKLGVDRTSEQGRAMADQMGEAWARLNHGQAGPLSSSDLAAAIQSYRTTRGDAVSAGGAAWTG